MLVSLKWLRDYVDIRIPLGELVDRLTMAGLEVEEIKEIGTEFTNVVVAKLLSVKTHPETDKYYFCEVAAGDGTYSVVCGARNIKPGDVVPLAKIVATLPGGYTIKSSKIRSVVSEGMLCSEQELGIPSDTVPLILELLIVYPPGNVAPIFAKGTTSPGLMLRAPQTTG